MHKWERVLLLVMTTSTFVGAIVGGILFFGGEWRWMKDTITNLSRDVVTMQEDVGSVRRQIHTIEFYHQAQIEADRIRDERRTPSFGPPNSSVR